MDFRPILDTLLGVATTVCFILGAFLDWSLLIYWDKCQLDHLTKYILQNIFNGGLMEPILDFFAILIQVLGVGHLICNKKHIC